MDIIDLTHTLVDHMQVYPGDEPPVLVQTRFLGHDGYSNSRLTTGMHTGTHIDGPLHMVDVPEMISDMPLRNFIGKAVVIDISGQPVFSDFERVQSLAKGCTIVLFYTGYAELFGTPAYETGYPVIHEAVADCLAGMGVKMIGVDTFSPDDAPHLTHTSLLGKGILIAENLTNLDLLPAGKSFTVIALPLKINADSAPARVIALVE